jgi:hypothetical protein
LPRIICKIEKIESEKHNRNKEKILQYIIPYLDDMFGTKISSDEHTKPERYSPSYIILTSYEYTKKCPNEPEEGQYTRYSLRFERTEFEYECIIEKIPYTRTRWKEISHNREYKIGTISDIFTNF